MKRHAQLAAVGLLFVLGGCWGSVDCEDLGDPCSLPEGDNERCLGEQLWECNFDEFYACWYWESGRDCADDGLVCRESGNDAACVVPG